MKLVRYTTPLGKQPLTEWLESFKDKKTLFCIEQRIDRLELGLFGDCKAVGDGVLELRMHFGSGYRVYFALDGDEIVLLFSGGDKKSQKADIQQSREYWQDYQEVTYGKENKT